MANKYTKFEVSTFSHLRDILGGVKIKMGQNLNGSHHHNHTPFGKT